MLAEEMFQVLVTAKGHDVGENVMNNNFFNFRVHFSVVVSPVKQKSLHTRLLAFILTSAAVCLVLLFKLQSLVVGHLPDTILALSARNTDFLSLCFCGYFSCGPGTR